jgi:hypothetical protein
MNPEKGQDGGRRHRERLAQFYGSDAAAVAATATTSATSKASVTVPKWVKKLPPQGTIAELFSFELADKFVGLV